MNRERIVNYAFRILRDWHLADTAAQYALQYAWKHPDASPARCAFRGVNRVRTERIREAKKLAKAKEQPKPGSYTAGSVAHYLADLPEHLADTARLLANGCSPADCATMLGVSREAISKRIDKIRLALM